MDFFKKIITNAKVENLFGEVPFFVYDEILLDESIQSVFHFLTEAGLRRDKSLFYFSYKSCPNEFIVKKILNSFHGVDVSSAGEYDEVKKLGVSPAKISVSGPAKTSSFLRELILDNVSTIHFDSIEEVDDYCRLMKETSSKVSTVYTCRLNFDSTSKLGMSLEELKANLNQKKLNFTGVHVYLGREKFKSETLAEVIKIMGELKAEHNGITDFFFGPGLSHELLGHAWTEDKFSDQKLRWHFEMGRAVVDHSCFYFAKVLAAKNKNATMDIIINGGIQHYQSAFTDIKKLSSYYTRILNSELTVVDGKTEANVYGSLCLPSDLFAWLDHCPDSIARGWWIGFFPCGAYNISASPNDFIKQDKPAVYFHNKAGKFVEI